MNWFKISWWKYLLEKPSNYYDSSRIRSLICRARNHPAGVVWYNVGGLEPDMHCKNCGDDLG